MWLSLPGDSDFYALVSVLQAVEDIFQFSAQIVGKLKDRKFTERSAVHFFPLVQNCAFAAFDKL